MTVSRVSVLPGGARAEMPRSRKSRLMRLGAKHGLEVTMVCGAHIALSMAAPILFDRLRRMGDGHFPFSIAALAFHSYFLAVLLGLGWALMKRGRQGLQQFMRPDMMVRFFSVAALSAVGDMLSIASMEHLDAGTFTLIGKGFTIIITVALARALLGRKQTAEQYAIVGALATATLMFCQAEAGTRENAPGGRYWALGLAQRSAGVLCTSAGAVLQEGFLRREPDTHFIVQQVWISLGAMLVSLAAMRVQSGTISFAVVFEGFDQWPTYVAISLYVTHAIVAGLLVKRFGALTKALCVPFVLGGCYMYSVLFDATPVALQAVAAWLSSTCLIVVFAASKAREKDVAGSSGKARPGLVTSGFQSVRTWAAAKPRQDAPGAEVVALISKCGMVPCKGGEPGSTKSPYDANEMV